MLSFKVEFTREMKYEIFAMKYCGFSRHAKLWRLKRVFVSLIDTSGNWSNASCCSHLRKTYSVS